VAAQSAHDQLVVELRAEAPGLDGAGKRAVAAVVRSHGATVPARPAASAHALASR
jgi:hypothetical protein